MTVTYRLEPTGNGPQVREVLLTAACPTCGADWTGRDNPLPRGSQRHFLCTACLVHHEAVLVDETGAPVVRG